MAGRRPRQIANMKLTRQLAALFVGLLAAASVPCAARAADSPEDSIAQRAKPCVACHGVRGRAGPDGYYPRIAGKPGGYLFRQLVAFRDGTRTYEPMAYLLQGMPDAYLNEFASYFAEQRLPYDSPSAIGDQRLLDKGQHLALDGDPARKIPACTSCHGSHLLGVEPNVPGLAGLPQGYLNAELGAWRIGRRKAAAPDCMAEIANRLDPSDVTAVVAWLASVTPAADGAPDPRSSAAPPMDCGDFHPMASHP